MKCSGKITLIFFLICLIHSPVFSQEINSDASLTLLEHANELLEIGKDVGNEDGEFVTACVEVIRQCADLENPQASYMAGVFYMLGVGVSANNDVGEKYLELAASKGFREAQALLVREYRSGDHLKKNTEKADLWEEVFFSNQNSDSLKASSTHHLASLNKLLSKAIHDSYGSGN